MKDLDRLVEWFKKRVSVHKYEEHHLKFIMTEYAKIYHTEQLALCGVVERYLFEGRDLTNNEPFKKVIDAENRESAIADMEVTYPHLKWVMTTKV